MMRTFSEIVNDVRDNNMPTYEEIWWALLAAHSMMHLDHMKFFGFQSRIDSGKSVDLLARLHTKAHYAAHFRFMRSDPREWLGPNNDPASPEFQEFRKMAQRIGEKIVAKVEGESGKP